MIAQDSAGTRLCARSITRAGGVVAFRTDTFYGLGADPLNREGVRLVRSLKGREDAKPILVLISDEREIYRFIARRTERFEAVSARHWPGALTLVASARAELPEELTARTGTIGLRLPDDEAVREFVRACGGALTATSANVTGGKPAQTAHEVLQEFPNGLQLIVDGGAARADKPSTVLDLSQPQARLIREGLIARDELQRTLEMIGVDLR